MAQIFPIPLARFYVVECNLATLSCESAKDIAIEGLHRGLECFYGLTSTLDRDGGTFGSSGIITEPKFCLLATS